MQADEIFDNLNKSVSSSLGISAVYEPSVLDTELYVFIDESTEYVETDYDSISAVQVIRLEFKRNYLDHVPGKGKIFQVSHFDGVKSYKVIELLNLEQDWISFRVKEI